MATEQEESFFKDYYDTEIDRMHKLDANVTFPSAVITVLGGWLVYYFQNAPPISSSVFAILFYLLLAIGIGAWIISIVYLIRSYCWHPYRLISNADEIANFLREMRGHYEDELGAEQTEEVDKKVDGEMRSFLLEQYQQNGAHNRNENLNRVNHLYRSHLSIVACLVALFISIIPFLVVYEKKPQKVQIEKGPDVNAIRLSRNLLWRSGVMEQYLP